MRNICRVLCFALVGANLAGAQFSAGPRSPYLNVCHDTPLGDFPNNSDITAPLQWAIDHQREGEGFEPFIPAGTYEISKTIRIPNGRNGSLRGMGRGDNNTANAWRQTRLVYRGDPTEPAILYQGNDWQISDLCLAGRLVRESRDRPAIGILSTTVKRKGDPRYQPTGTTQLHLRQVTFSGWETCFQNGDNLKTHNSDLHTITDCRFSDCNIGFHNLHNMGMEIVFTRIKQSHDCQICIQFDAGGSVYIHDASAGGGSNGRRYLVTGGQVGQASGGFVIDGFKVDGSLNGTTDWQLIEAREPASTRYVVSNLTQSNTNYQKNGGVLATIQGDSQLTLRDSYRPAKIICHEQDQGPGRRTRRPHILVDNCWLAGGVLDIEGPHSLVVRDCIEWGRWEKDDDFTFSHVPNSVDSD